jgi:hypothetical protein
MARGTLKKFVPINPKKYLGDPTRIMSRSNWEFKLMVKFDQSSDVLAWASEEIVLKYLSPVDNRVHRYFTDFLVVNKDKRVTLIEVKPYAQTQPPIMKKGRRKDVMVNETCTYLVNQAKWKAAEEYCRQRGWTFKVITEKEIPQFIGGK